MGEGKGREIREGWGGGNQNALYTCMNMSKNLIFKENKVDNFLKETRPEVDL